MNRMRVMWSVLVVVSGLTAGEFQVKFSSPGAITPKNHAACVQGKGQIVKIDGRLGLAIDQDYSDPVLIKTPPMIKNSEQGSIKFYYRPNLPPVPEKKALTLHTLLFSRDNASGNSVVIGLNQYKKAGTYPYFMIVNPAQKLNNYGPYKGFKLTPLRWHRFEVSWDKETMRLAIDGQLVQACPRKGQVKFGKFCYLSGRLNGWPKGAPGWLADFTFGDQPIK